MQRYFIKNIDNNFILEDSDFHHIKDVMRLKSGDNIVCVCDRKSYLCSIDINNLNYKINIIKEITNDVELPKKVILYQALIKNDKFDFVVQKACELGVSDIYPTVFNRSVINVSNVKVDAKIDRYNRILKESCEQCRRLTIPTFHNYIKVNEIKINKNTLGILAFENNDNFYSLNDSLENIKDYDSVAIIVGPEGGIEEKEVNYLQSIGFKNCSLGKRILRSETASISLLSIISYYLEGKR